MSGNASGAPNPNYRGKSYNPNFVDPRSAKPASKPSRPSTVKPPQPHQTNQPAPSKPSPPSSVGKPSETQDNPLYTEAIFGTAIYAREREPRKHVLVSMSWYTSLINEMFSYLIVEEKIRKLLHIEALRYYCTVLLWIRITKLKKSDNRPLTQHEEDFLEVLEDLNLNVPQPIYLALNAIGETVTKNGEKFNPIFPDLPIHVPGGAPNGGYFAEDLLTHPGYNQYLEIPTIGIAAEALSRSVHNENGAWIPLIANRNPPLVVQPNLLNYSVTVSPKPEVRNRYITGANLAPGVFPEDVPATGLSVSVMEIVSECLGLVEAFKNLTDPIVTYPNTGTRAQLILNKPERFAPNQTLYVNSEFVHESLNSESKQSFGVAAKFQLQMYKESREPQQAIGHNNWTIYIYQDLDHHRIEPDIVANRNARRTADANSIPARFRTDPQFFTISREARAERRELLEELKTSK